MTLSFFIGDLLTGLRLQAVPAAAGSWSEVLNDAGELSCAAPLSDPAVRALGLRESAIPGKSFLAAVDDGVVLQAGPIWTHDYDRDDDTLTLTAAGMWSYFDHRVLLPILAGRNPADPATDTRYSPVSVDPDDPWPVDTTKSLQAIARVLVLQAQAWTSGNVPVILPAEIAGTSERWYKGADLAIVGERLKQLTQVEGGPDIMFTPRLNSTATGVEWVMRIGTPTQPLLFSPQQVVFHVGTAASTVSRLQVNVDGTALASQAFAAGGRSEDIVLITQSTSGTLTGAGYPLLEAVDSSHTTVSVESTLQTYSDELVARSVRPVETWTFSHDATQRPFVGTFNAGDFAEVRVKDDHYLQDGPHRMRITSRSGDVDSKNVALSFQPEVT